jgi:hypothetical protein
MTVKSQIHHRSSFEEETLRGRKRGRGEERRFF